MKVHNKSVRNFERYLKVWNSIFSFSGISPVLPHLDRKGKLEYRSSLLMMSVSGLVIAVSSLVIYFQTEDNKFDLSNIPKLIITGYLAVFSSVLIIAKTVTAIWDSKSYAALSTNFLKFNRNNYRARVDKILLQSTKFICLYIILLLSSFFYDIFILQDHDFINPKFLLHYFPRFYNFLYICQFAVCCFWVTIYLSDINADIKRHSQYIMHSFDERLKFYRLDSIFPASSPAKYSSTEVHISKMKYIRRLYHQLYLLTSQVNKVFSTTICIMLVDNFFLSTFLIYYGLGELENYGNHISSLSIFDVLYYFKQAVMCFLFIYGLIWPTSKVYYQAGVTVELIQEYFPKVPAGGLQTEFYNFVIQLYQEKISFSPHGFFFLNNRLLLSIIGSVASSLVILIQFRIKVV